MAIEQKKCDVCGADYHGSKNSKYCSQKCNQKAYRDRNKPVYECGVNGFFSNGNAMCGSIGIGRNEGICTYSNRCDHKIKKEQ